MMISKDVGREMKTVGYKLRVQYWPIDKVKPYQNNPRNNDEAVEYVANSIREFSFQQPLVVDSDGTIIAGHTRLKAAKLLGMETVPVVVADNLTPAQVNAYRLADNKVAEAATWDMEALAVELDGLEIDFDMTMFDFEESEFNFGGSDSEQTETFEDEIPDDSPSRVSPGDVWQLGRHTLMCGDSTDPESVSRLMGGARAELLFTSPPYADMRTYNGGKELSTELLARFIPAYAPHCEYQAVNMGIKRQDHEIVQYWDDYIASAHDAGLKLMAWNVWDKMMCGSVGQQMSFVPIRHEFIFVFGTKDRPLNKTWEKKPENIGRFNPKRRRNADGTMSKLHSTRGSVGDVSNPYKEMESVVSVMVETGAIREKHPAVFPVGLPAEYIKAFTDEGDVVAEPFGGSGTTLIACEQLGRECRCMELDPSYCDVIIERWQNLTGETARKVDTDGQAD